MLAEDWDVVVFFSSFVSVAEFCSENFWQVQKTYGTMTAAVLKWSPTFAPIQSPDQTEVSSSTRKRM